MTITVHPVERTDFLRGVRVLEIGDGVAGAAAAAALWMLGAEVTAVVDPNSVHRRGRPSVRSDGRSQSLLAASLDRGKHVIETGDDLTALVAAEGADVVIVDRVAGATGPLLGLADPERYAAAVAGTNRTAWVTISAFGLSGPRAGEFATELTLAAASGMLATVRDPASQEPLKLAGFQSLLNAGQAAALASCHAIDTARDGDPVHLDLSVQEATIATGPVLEVGGITLSTGSRGGARRYGAPAGFYDCSDGVARVSAMEDHQWQGVVKSMGSPDWAADYATVASRIEAADEIDAHVAAWCRERTKREVETVMQANGVPATAVYSPREVLESPQLEDRGALRDLPVAGTDARMIGLPVNAGTDDSPPRRRRLRGLRVLEASRVLAVPLCGALLGSLGAEVTKLEDLPRLDMYRRRGPYIDGEEGMNRSAYFTLFNHSKASAAFDVDADRERLDALIEASDVVLENLGPKRAQAIGLDGASVAEHHPGRLSLSSSGFGLVGPHSRYRAYAYNLQASCALGYLTRSADGRPAEIDLAWADLISGFALATYIAAWAVGPEGNTGAVLDFSMAELIISHFNEFLAAASIGIDTETEADRANEQAPYAPCGVYPVDGGFVAITVDGDDEFAALAKVLEASALADPAFASDEGRRARLAELDRAVAAATTGRDATELVAQLTAAGVMAETVVNAAGLLADTHLAARGFFGPIDHPEWGVRQIVGIPWRPCGGEPIALAAPPLFQPEEDRR